MVGSTDLKTKQIQTSGEVRINLGAGIIEGQQGSSVNIGEGTAKEIINNLQRSSTPQPQTDKKVLDKVPNDAIPNLSEPFKSVPTSPSKKGIPEVNPLEPKKVTEEGLQVDKQAVFKAMKTNMAKDIADIKKTIPVGLRNLGAAGLEDYKKTSPERAGEMYEAAEKLSAAFRKNIPVGVTLSPVDVKEFFASLDLPPIVKDLALEDMIRDATNKKVK